MPPKIDLNKCTGCGECEKICPMGAIKVTGGKAQVDANACADCRACETACPNGAISF